MTMILPNDPTTGNRFFWTRQGISLQQLLTLIAEMIANGGIVIPGGGGGGGDVGGGGASTGYTLVEDPAHPGLFVISTTGGTGGVVVGGTGLALGTTTGTAADAGAVAAALLVKAPITSPDFLGVPTAPTAATGTNTNQLATTAYVLANGGGGGSVSLTDPHFLGTPTAPTAIAGTNTTQLATTAFVAAGLLLQQGVLDSHDTLLTSLATRLAALETTGANVTAIFGAASARNNPATGIPLGLGSVVIWLVDGTAPAAAIDGDIVLNRITL